MVMSGIKITFFFYQLPVMLNAAINDLGNGLLAEFVSENNFILLLDQQFDEYSIIVSIGANIFPAFPSGRYFICATW